MAHRPHKRILWIAAILALAALACNLPAARIDATVTPTVTELPGEGDTPQPPAEDASPEPVTETPTPDDESPAEDEPTDDEPGVTVAVPSGGTPPEHGEAIYTTDFTSGWTTVTSERDGEVRGNAEVTAEGYLFEVAESWGHWVFTTRADAGAFYAEITATPRECPAGRGAYGLLFHHADNSNYRAFMVTCGGDYALREVADGDEDALTQGPLPEGIDPSTGEHALAVWAYQDALTLFVDGLEIGAVSITNMPTGDFGPYTETADDAITVLFTQLEVYEPE